MHKKDCNHRGCKRGCTDSCKPKRGVCCSQEKRYYCGKDNDCIGICKEDDIDHVIGRIAEVTCEHKLSIEDLFKNQYSFIENEECEGGFTVKDKTGADIFSYCSGYTFEENTECEDGGIIVRNLDSEIVFSQCYQGDTTYTFEDSTDCSSDGFVVKNESGEIVYEKCIGCCTEEVTRSQLLALIKISLIKKNTLYTVTDVDPTLYGGTEIYMLGVDATSISVRGTGKFYTPKYKQSDSTIGIWNTGLTPSIGSKIIWGYKTWQNLNGNVGTTPTDDFTLDPTEWIAIPFNDFDYNIKYDLIEYNINTNQISYREDEYLNRIYRNSITVNNKNPIKVFQWGRYQVYDNFISSGSYANIINTNFGNFHLNRVEIMSYLEGNEIDKTSQIYGNIIVTTIIENNSFVDNARLNYNSFDRCEMSTNNMTNGIIIGKNKVKLFDFIGNELNISSTIDNNDFHIGNITNCVLTSYSIRANSFNYGTLANSILSSDGLAPLFTGFFSNTIKQNSLIDGLTCTNTEFKINDLIQESQITNVESVQSTSSGSGGMNNLYLKKSIIKNQTGSNKMDGDVGTDVKKLNMEYSEIDNKNLSLATALTASGYTKDLVRTSSGDFRVRYLTNTAVVITDDNIF